MELLDSSFCKGPVNNAEWMLGFKRPNPQMLGKFESTVSPAEDCS